MGNALACGIRQHRLYKDAVLIVHANGLVEKFPLPIRARELTVDYPDHFICHSNDIKIMHLIPTLTDEDELELGEIYYLLPVETFQAVLSESDVTDLLSKAAVARQKSKKDVSAKQLTVSPAPKHIQIRQKGETTQVTVSPEFIDSLLSESSSNMDRRELPTLNIGDAPEIQAAYNEHLSAKIWRSWTPRLATIEEGSFQMS